MLNSGQFFTACYKLMLTMNTFSCKRMILLISFKYCCEHHTDGLVQERRNSIANALESRLSCTEPSIYGVHMCQKLGVSVRLRASTGTFNTACFYRRYPDHYIIFITQRKHRQYCAPGTKCLLCPWYCRSEHTKTNAHAICRFHVTYS